MEKLTVNVDGIDHDVECIEAYHGDEDEERLKRKGCVRLIFFYKVCGVSYYWEITLPVELKDDKAYFKAFVEMGLQKQVNKALIGEIK